MNLRESELNEKQDWLVIDGNPPERWATQPKMPVGESLPLRFNSERGRGIENEKIPEQ